MTADDGQDHPYRDLADLSVGRVAFATVAFLLLEIGATLAGARIGTFGPRAPGPLTLEAIVTAIELTIVTMILAIDRVHPSEIGLRLRSLPRGALLGLAIWGLCQLGLAIVSVGRHGTLSLYVGWAEPAAMIAPLLRHFLTDVFADEIFWRGLLFVWIVRALEKRRWKEPLSRLGTGLICSQLLFGVTRLPALVLSGATGAIPPGASLVIFTMTGMFYALIYLRTENLWLVMAVHALALWPLPLFAFDLDPSKLTVLVAAVLLIPSRWGASVVSDTRRGSPADTRG